MYILQPPLDLVIDLRGDKTLYITLVVLVGGGKVLAKVGCLFLILKFSDVTASLTPFG